MNNGISLYLGLDNSLAENLHLLEAANHCGIRRIFTSLHIPETDVQRLKSELQIILQQAQRFNLEVISDVSPNTLALLDLTDLEPEKLWAWGITTIRLDFGYDCKTIAKLSKSDLKLQFNASTITREFLQELYRWHTDFTHIDALHNFYPREGTGLSADKLLMQNKLLHEYNIKTAAFVPSYNRARSPLKKGLPTMEVHRYQPMDFGMRHLILLGTDSVFIGDSLPTLNELRQLSTASSEYISLKAKCLTQKGAVKQKLQQQLFTVRLDMAQTVIRTQESRAVFKDIDIVHEFTAKRSIGSITLDNDQALRYKGELQIITKEQASDDSVNVVGRLLDRELILLNRLQSGSKFKIEFI